MCCISVVLVTMETKLYKLKDLELNIISFPRENTFTIDSFDILKFILAVRLGGHKERKLKDIYVIFRLGGPYSEKL